MIHKVYNEFERQLLDNKALSGEVFYLVDSIIRDDACRLKIVFTSPNMFIYSDLAHELALYLHKYYKCGYSVPYLYNPGTNEICELKLDRYYLYTRSTIISFSSMSRRGDYIVLSLRLNVGKLLQFLSAIRTMVNRNLCRKYEDDDSQIKISF